jgi:crossover junction endodeoxyribonuclease RuvC
MRILGIDPGTTRIGYGIIRKENGKLLFEESGLLKVGYKKQNSSLPMIESSFATLLKRTHPDRIAFEKIFFTKNKKTAIEVAHARGVLMNVALKTKIPIFEFTPPQIKLSVTGDGRATKEGVSKMVFKTLLLPQKALLDDITDALAVAITASSFRD